MLPPPWTPSPPLLPPSSIATYDIAVPASLQHPGSQHLTSNEYMQSPNWLLHLIKPHLAWAGPADLFDLPDEDTSDAERDSNAGSAQEDGDGGFGMVEHDSDAATILYSTLKGRCGLDSRP